MRHDLQVKLLRQFFEHHQARTQPMAERLYRNPASVYTDPERLAAERERLFRGGALIVGLSGDLPAVGEYFTSEADGVPLLVVRGEDGAVRAFVNACRHRGGRVAEGRGLCGRTFNCPYHAWCYDIHGRLVGQPLAQQAFAELDREGTGLIAVPAAERFGLIFVRPGGGAPIDVEVELSGLGPEIEDLHLANYRLFRELSRTWDMNWKLGLDTFLESYHIFSLHRTSLAGDFLSAPSLFEAFGPHSRLVPFRRTVLGLTGVDEEDWNLRAHASVLYRFLPNVVFNLTIAGQVELWEFFPEDGSPHRSRVTMKFYTPGEVGSDKERDFWERNVKLTSTVVFDEDFAQQQVIHRNLRSGMLPEVHYGRNEPALIHFHQSLAAVLG
ncbi:MAG: aromatic ring-hydroxylating dioxygenase subunit alpha [Actinobacteria bacterium]|nr:aromatic ring-hydroxylating dioxygenase subunit alpha [Actinomycetota bacterium]